jgi:hypothetical protein
MKNSSTARERENIDHVRKLASKTGRHILDLSDERQWEYLMASAHKSGVTPQTHPCYFASLERSRKKHLANGGPPAPKAASADSNGLENANDISSLGITTGGSNSEGSGFSSVVGGTIYTRLQLEILDIKTGKSLGFKDSGPIMDGGFYTALSTLGNPPPPGDGMQLMYTYSYLPIGNAGLLAGENDPVNGVVTRSTNETPFGAPTVVQPIRTKTNNYIKIGLGRPVPPIPPDCDYYYNEPNLANPNIRLPMVGSQRFQSNIVTPLVFPKVPPGPNDPVPTCIVTALVSKTTGGGSTSPLPVTLNRYPNAVTASGSTLNWSFPWNYDVTRDLSMQFGPAAWANDTTVLSLFSIQVKTATSAGEWVFVNIFSSTTPPWAVSQSPGTYSQYPIYYTWHCVAAGTLVTRADGSTMKIEEMTGGEKVKVGPGGETFTVVDTFHTAKEATIIALCTEAGHELMITDMHPVRTDKGIVVARDLRAGTVVLTDKGPSPLKSVETRPFSGMVHCIGLGADAEEEKRFTIDNTCFYANGILVGDNRLSLLTRHSWQSSLEAILERLPKEWHPEARLSHERRRQELAHA